MTATSLRASDLDNAGRVLAQPLVTAPYIQVIHTEQTHTPHISHIKITYTHTHTTLLNRNIPHKIHTYVHIK